MKSSKVTPSKVIAKQFDYDLNYPALDLRKRSFLYRVGRGEQGVLLVEPYKSEILPFWRFKTSEIAQKSTNTIFKLFKQYRDQNDFVGMDMARKFLQMGYTRSRRYANHASGRKYGTDGKLLPFKNDPVKAQSADVFKKIWKKVELDPTYAALKTAWKKDLG